jgi:hypothetical protein
VKLARSTVAAAGVAIAVFVGPALAAVHRSSTRHADCSGWVVSHTDVSGGVTASKGAGVSWPSKKAACAWAKKQLKRATLDENGGRIPGWNCSSQFGAATCTRHKVTIVFVWQ